MTESLLPHRRTACRIAARTLALLTTLVTLLTLTSTPAFAHGGGVIRLASPQAPVGGTLALSGEKLEKNSTFKLELRGTLDNYPIGDAKTDTAGKFRMSIALPAHVPAGVYSLVAVGPDGDVDARVDLTIAGAAGSGAGGMAGMSGMASMGQGTQEMSGMHATDEMMAIERTTTAGEWVVIWVLILAALGGGAVLLRKAARQS